MTSTTPLYSGVLTADKPAGMTSHDVVAAVRRILHMRDGKIIAEEQAHDAH